jgi:hypothetical protein
MMAAVCGRLYYRHRRPWWHFHCTMIRIYIDTSAHESTVAQQQGREFNVKNAIRSMMRRAHPEWDDSQAEEFILRQLSRCRAPEFIDSVVAYSHRRMSLNGVGEEIGS